MAPNSSGNIHVIGYVDFAVPPVPLIFAFRRHIERPFPAGADPVRITGNVEPH